MTGRAFAWLMVSWRWWVVGAAPGWTAATPTKISFEGSWPKHELEGEWRRSLRIEDGPDGFLLWPSPESRFDVNVTVTPPSSGVTSGAGTLSVFLFGHSWKPFLLMALNADVGGYGVMYLMFAAGYLPPPGYSGILSG